MKLTAFILLCLYFLYKGVAAIYVVLSYSNKELNEIQKGLNKSLYHLGYIEHFFMLALVNLLYWLN